MQMETSRNALAAPRSAAVKCSIDERPLNHNVATNESVEFLNFSMFLFFSGCCAIPSREMHHFDF